MRLLHQISYFTSVPTKNIIELIMWLPYFTLLLFLICQLIILNIDAALRRNVPRYWLPYQVDRNDFLMELNQLSGVSRRNEFLGSSSSASLEPMASDIKAAEVFESRYSNVHETCKVILAREAIDYLLHKPSISREELGAWGRSLTKLLKNYCGRYEVCSTLLYGLHTLRLKHSGSAELAVSMDALLKKLMGNLNSDFCASANTEWDKELFNPSRGLSKKLGMFQSSLLN